MSIKQYLDQYVASLSRIMTTFVATDANGFVIPQVEALAQIQARMKTTHALGGTLLWVGNGGSQGICSHLSFDYTKNGKMRSRVFSDPSHLTGGANDLGHENVYAKNLEWYGRPEDLAICISSSGNSANIVGAAKKAKEMGMFTLTLSAFGADNALRTQGHVNIWLDTGKVMYGYAENGHQIILHAILEHSIFGYHENKV
jgi:D-sedoheptulose 7-phosphate isomerase